MAEMGQTRTCETLICGITEKWEYKPIPQRRNIVKFTVARWKHSSSRLSSVGAQRALARVYRYDQCDIRLRNRLLELPVTSTVVTRLDRPDRLAGCDRENLDQVGDAWLRLRFVLNLGAPLGSTRFHLLPLDV